MRDTVTWFREEARSSSWARNGLRYAAILFPMIATGLVALKYIAPTPEEAKKIRAQHPRVAR